jgi:hypothetical protein
MSTKITSYSFIFNNAKSISVKVETDQQPEKVILRRGAKNSFRLCLPTPERIGYTHSEFKKCQAIIEHRNLVMSECRAGGSSWVGKVWKC